jgi:hypothetical protein
MGLTDCSGTPDETNISVVEQTDYQDHEEHKEIANDFGGSDGESSRHDE